MNSLKPAGGWVGTLGEGELNTVGRAELMACVVAVGEHARQCGLRHRTTKSSRKGKIGVGPHRALDKAATLTFGGDCPVPWKRGKEHLRCSGSVRILTLPTSRLRIMTWRLYLGNEMADAVAKKAASEAAVRGAAAEQIAWVDAMA